MINSSTIFLMANGAISQYILIAAIVFIFYFFMIRPQTKRQNEQKSFLGDLKKGDKVVTIGGINGEICSIDDILITLEIDNKGSKLTVIKEAISFEHTKRIYGHNDKK